MILRSVVLHCGLLGNVGVCVCRFGLWHCRALLGSGVVVVLKNLRRCLWWFCVCRICACCDGQCCLCDAADPWRLFLSSLAMSCACCLCCGAPAWYCDDLHDDDVQRCPWFWFCFCLCSPASLPFCELVLEIYTGWPTAWLMIREF